MTVQIDIPSVTIREFCRAHQIQRLSVFGSALGDDFRPDSDLDVLVEFVPGTRVGMLGLASMEGELSQQLGISVDLNTPGFLSEEFRQQVCRDAEVQYDLT
jgi:predicted nucleotidyltransferase